jgi:MFS family permease
MEHPILYGTICAFAFAIIYYGLRNGSRRIWYLALCTFGCVLAMSSAPLLSLFIAIGIIVYDRLLGSYPWRWKLFWYAILLLVVALVVVKDDPVQTLIRNFTLDAQTGFYRLMIWEYAGAEALNSPFVGIGKRDWQRIPGMDSSVDTIWLVFALQYGIPTSILFGLAMLTSMRRSGPPVPERHLDPYLVKMRRGLSITICLAFGVGFTVHLWGVMLTLLGMLMGLRTTLEEMRGREIEALLTRQRQLAAARSSPHRRL